MTQSRITDRSRTTVPKAVREALKLHAGDRVSYQIDRDRVVLRRYGHAASFEHHFAIFTEWAGEADRVYDQLAVCYPAA